MRPDSSLAIDSDGEYYVVEKTNEVVNCTMNKRCVPDETKENKDRKDSNRIDFANMPPILNVEGIDWAEIDKELEAENDLKKKDDDSTANESDDELFDYKSDDERQEKHVNTLKGKEKKKAKKKLRAKETERLKLREMLDKPKNRHLQKYLPENLKKWYIDNSSQVRNVYVGHRQISMCNLQSWMCCCVK